MYKLPRLEETGKGSMSYVQKNCRSGSHICLRLQFHASATFLDDNPRFVQVGHDDTTESYIDMNTIQSVRYDPPYYIIRLRS